MTELAERGRALLDLARDAHDPSEADRVRVRSALAARLGAAAGLGVAAGVTMSAKAVLAGSTAGGSATAVVGTTLTIKLIGAALFIATAAGTGAVAVHRARRDPGVSVVARSSSPADRDEPRVTAPAPVSAPAVDQQVPPTPAPEARTSATAAPVIKKRVPTVVARMPAKEKVRLPAAPPPEVPDSSDEPAFAETSEHTRPQVGPAAQPAKPALIEESRLMHDGLAALRAGDAARALALFDAHAIFYPHGALAVERAAERVLALAALGRVSAARTAMAEFLREHPTSPLAARLRKRLGELDVSAR